MIRSFRNFAKTKFAGILVFIIIIPFVFWGMGSMFSGGNTNSLAKVNNKNISTQEFIDHLNNSGIPEKSIQENLNNNIIEELLTSLISTTLLDLEIQNFNIIFSESSLLKRIKKNKNFLDDDGNFQRIKYEKFLLENNISAPQFELQLKGRELQKKLFDYIGAGTVAPNFMVKRLFEEENKKLEIEYINLENFYEKGDNISEKKLKDFIDDNKDQIKIEYVDFKYAILSPQSLLGIDDFNQAFFDKIDQIEIDISNEIKFENIISKLNINSINVSDFKFSSEKKDVEKKIFELRNTNIDIFEYENDYIIYNIDKIEERAPDLKDVQTKKEIIRLVEEKSKFEYNKKLLEKIRSKNFDENDFLKLGMNQIKKGKINSIRDNKKFDINAIKLMYSLPINSFTLINDDKNNIYLAKIVKFKNENFDINDKNYDEYLRKEISISRNSVLVSYDMLLSDKYNIVINQKTIERVKNFFK
tara:strand:+ start:50 stop:1468 length:1419 start_codon:yes stop_codon:yes gene_type:complete